MVYIKADNTVHCCINFCHSHYVDFFFYFYTSRKVLYISVANEWQLEYSCQSWLLRSSGSSDCYMYTYCDTGYIFKKAFFIADNGGDFHLRRVSDAKGDHVNEGLLLYKKKITPPMTFYAMASFSYFFFTFYFIVRTLFLALICLKYCLNCTYIIQSINQSYFFKIKKSTLYQATCTKRTARHLSLAEHVIFLLHEHC